MPPVREGSEAEDSSTIGEPTGSRQTCWVLTNTTHFD